MKRHSMQYRVWVYLQKHNRPISIHEIAKACGLSAETAGKTCFRIADRYGAVKNLQPISGSRGHSGLWQAVDGVSVLNLLPGANKALHKRAAKPAGQSNAACSFRVPPCELERVWPHSDPLDEAQRTAEFYGQGTA